MGFPVGYPEVLVPNIFLHILSLLACLRSLILSLFSLLHLSDLLDTDLSAVTSPESQSQFQSQSQSQSQSHPTLSALLIREFLPVVKFGNLAGGSSPLSAGCAVCLNEFTVEEEIRCMANCRHIFHRACVDRWIDHDQKTCPLCRTHFVPYHKMEDYNQRLWSFASESEEEQEDVSIFSQYEYDDDYFIYTATTPSSL